jgi:hypothetical protein
MEDYEKNYLMFNEHSQHFIDSIVKPRNTDWIPLGKADESSGYGYER